MSVSEIGLVLLIACVVAMVSRQLHLPYSVGLVSAGIVLALSGGASNLTLTPELIYKVLLPPLIFEAALQLKWRPFRADLLVTSTLAFPGTLISFAVVAIGLHAILGWTWLGAAMFGALIAATDPVSVIAAFKEMRVEPRLSMIVEAESLLNDGAAAVIFAVLVTVAQNAMPHAGQIAATLLWMVLGGIAVGAVLSGAVLLLAGRTEDHLVEITLTTIAAYGSFLLADNLHMSGVLASLAAGLVVGNVGWRGAISETGRGHVVSFWEYIAFLANSVVFILIGSREAHQAKLLFTSGSAIIVCLVLAARIITIYPLCLLFAASHLKISWRYQHVLVWGGLRGALALALALAVPASVKERGAIIVAAFAVVAFSIFAQGITMPWMIHALRLGRARRAINDAG
jgi:CPA1 family monovalent cation:H+ antiporter